MAARPSGPHDELPFLRGAYDTTCSYGQLDLQSVQEPADEELPALHVWFNDEQIALDISAAFAEAPAGTLEGSGIPDAVLQGAVAIERGGDAGDGMATLLIQMCGGKITADPAALIGLVASEHVASLAPYEVEDDRQLRAFAATMSLHDFLTELGLRSAALVNQLAVIGFDLRHETSPEVLATFAEHLHVNQVQLAWLIDDADRIQTVQAVVTLTDFLRALFASDEMVGKLAAQEDASVDDIRAYLEQVETQGLAYVNAIWQSVEYHDDVDPVEWPASVDLTEAMATQARRLL